MQNFGRKTWETWA